MDYLRVSIARCVCEGWSAYRFGLCELPLEVLFEGEKCAVAGFVEIA